jgi:hypothetical protein
MPGRACQAGPRRVRTLSTLVTAADSCGGCARAPLVVRATRESGKLGNVGRRTSSTIIERLAFHFTVFGMDSAEARLRADAVVSAVEGALITAHALRNLSPFESVLAVLVDKANMLTVGAPKSVPVSH